MKKKPKTLTVCQCLQLLRELKNEDGSFIDRIKGRRNYAIAVLMLETGIRVGELVQLVISDVYFRGEPVNALCIRAAIAKRQHERTIPLSTRAKDALRDMVMFDKGYIAAMPDHPAFRHANRKTPLGCRQVQRIIKHAGDKAIGIPVNPHMLRHTFGSRLMRRCNSRIVQELLGHANLSSTQIYTHPNGDDLEKAIESLSTE